MRREECRSASTTSTQYRRGKLHEMTLRCEGTSPHGNRADGTSRRRANHLVALRGARQGGPGLRGV